MAEETSEQGTVRYIRCPSCGTPNPATAANCSRCGKSMQGKPAAAPAPPPPAPTPPALGQIACPKCRKPLPPTSRFCGYCGAPLAASAPVPPKPSEQMAPTQPMPVLSPGRVPPPVPKPVAPPPPPPPPPQRAAIPKVAPPALTPVQAPKPLQPLPPKVSASTPPAPSVAEGTKVFTGLHVPTVEASVVEVKQDGSTGKTIRVVKETVIGRGICDISYPTDSLLSPRHASIANHAGKIILKDLGSQNGSFLKQRQDTELVPGDVFLLGRELFRFATQGMDEPSGSTEGTQVLHGAPRLHPGPVTAKLERIQLNGEVIEEFKLDKPETTLGRTRGDLIFKNDPYMSGEHARVVALPGRFLLQDLKSRNGVYRKIRTEVELKHGDEFFTGEQIFRVEIKTS